MPSVDREARTARTQKRARGGLPRLRAGHRPRGGGAAAQRQQLHRAHAAPDARPAAAVQDRAPQQLTGQPVGRRRLPHPLVVLARPPQDAILSCCVRCGQPPAENALRYANFCEGIVGRLPRVPYPAQQVDVAADPPTSPSRSRRARRGGRPSRRRHRTRRPPNRSASSQPWRRASASGLRCARASRPVSPATRDPARPTSASSPPAPPAPAD